jgi:membrane-associated phospholipid phosphatase/putative flippase GtrA
VSTTPVDAEPSLAAAADSRGAPAPDAALIRFLCIAPALLLMVVLLADPELNHTLFLALNHEAALLPDSVWAMLSTLGGATYMCALALPWLLRRPRHIATLLLLLVVFGIGINLFKDIVNTPRPSWVLEAGSFQLLGPNYQHFSFPSGHAASAFAIALLIVDRLEYRLLPSLLVLGCALAIGLSRIAVGAHWPIDVAGGALLGALTAGGFLALTGSSSFFEHRAWRVVGWIMLAVVVAALLRSRDEFRGYAGVAALRWLLIGALAYAAYRELRPADRAGSPPGRLRSLLLYPDPRLLRLVRFGLIGLSGFCVDLSTYTVLLAKVGALPEVARVCAYGAAATSNWFFNRMFTFADRPRASHFVQWNKYLLMCVVSFVPNFGTFWVLIHTLPLFAAHTQLALVAGVLAGMFFNFAIASRWIFPRATVEA